MRVGKLAKTAVTLLSCSLGVAVISAPAHAQQSIKKNALEKTTYYTAPRQLQIIDDRPIIHDFREAPSDPGSIQLPPGPQGFGGPGGGGGGGAMAGGPGSSIPPGGMQMGGPNQGYRTAHDPMGALPKSGFGGTNIPARGMGPRGALPGVTQGVVGKMLSQQKPGAAAGQGAGAPRGMGHPSGPSNGNTNGPAVASYGGGYGSGSGSGYGGSASRTDTAVRGTLLHGGK